MIFRTNSISKSFGTRQVLDQVSLECEPGQVMALIGPNGAGKTTLFKVILGLLTPDQGTVDWRNGVKIPIGAIVEKPAFYAYLNARENLRLFARLQGENLDETEVDQALIQVGLDHRRKDAVRQYSMGMKQRLGIAIALLGDPEVLLLDEPFSGLDPMGIRSLSKLLKDLAHNQNKAVLISSHFMDQLIRFCDHISVMSMGVIVASGNSYDLFNQHSNSYRIEGPDLHASSVIKELGLHPDKFRLEVRTSQISMMELLQALLQEGTHITAAVPQLEVDQLMDPNP